MRPLEFTGDCRWPSGLRVAYNAAASQPENEGGSRQAAGSWSMTDHPRHHPPTRGPRVLPGRPHRGLAASHRTNFLRSQNFSGGLYCAGVLFQPGPPAGYLSWVYTQNRTQPCPESLEIIGCVCYRLQVRFCRLKRRKDLRKSAIYTQFTQRIFGDSQAACRRFEPGRPLWQFHQAIRW